jgi:polysaccharide deacetylase family protein (PEP-CTERM system associated)
LLIGSLVQGNSINTSQSAINHQQLLNSLTVDVEEWFHICGVPTLRPEAWPRLPSRVEQTTRLLLDELDAAGITATFFIVGWVAERYPGLVGSILEAGHHVGSHSFWHRRVYDLDRVAFADDLHASVLSLGAAGASAITAFRAPEWSINHRSEWALEVLVQQGFTVDASMAPLRIVGDVSYPRGPYVRSTRLGPIVEVPPLVADRFGHVMPMGWGWGLRMSQPARVLKEIERANAAGRPAVLTIHPWELDPDPPRVPLPAGLRFAHYFRLGGFLGRLRTILRGGAFGPLEAAASRAGSS